MTVAGSALWLGGFGTAAVVLALTVALLAGVAAAFDLCVGCMMYRQVGFFRELGVV